MHRVKRLFGFRITGVSTPQSTIRNPQWRGGGVGWDDRGFTLLELVVVMSLISIVAMLSAELISFGARLYTITNVRQELLQTGRMAVCRMTREIIGARTVLSADSTSFRFLDPDSTDITFALSGSQIVRNTDPLLDHVISFTYTYWDINDTELPVPVVTLSDIWQLEIVLTLLHLEESVTLQSNVYLRKGGT